MMKRGSMVKVGMVLLVAGLLAAGTGCDRLLVGTNTGSVITGWVLGSVWAGATNGATESLCYRNGVLVDCSEVPEGLGE